MLIGKELQEIIKPEVTQCKKFWQFKPFELPSGGELEAVPEQKRESGRESSTTEEIKGSPEKSDGHRMKVPKRRTVSYNLSQLSKLLNSGAK